MSDKHPMEIDSLVRFVQEKKKFWFPVVNILEIGCGHQSLFENISIEGPGRIVAIDQKVSLIERAREKFPLSQIEYHCSSLNDFQASVHFDLIIDSHSLHFCVGEQQIQEYLQKVDGLLSPGGIFMGEVMTYNKGLLFEMPYYFDHTDYVLYKMSGDHFVSQRSILTAYQWEQHLLSQFPIEYFYVDQGLCFDLPKLLESKVSLLKFICKKC